MTDHGPIAEIHVDELARLRASGAVIIDVRMPDEYHEAHVPGARLVPLPELGQRLDEVPTDATTYLVCRSGARSMKACEMLAAQGRDVVNVAGGTLAWIEAGHPVATGGEPG